MHLITNGGSVHFTAGTVTATRHMVSTDDLLASTEPVVVYMDMVANGHQHTISIGGTPADIEDFATALLRACDQATTELLHSIAYRQSVADLEVED
jgi:hypothetical protein